MGTACAKVLRQEETGGIRELQWLSMAAVQGGRKGWRIQGLMEMLRTQSYLPASLPCGLPPGQVRTCQNHAHQLQLPPSGAKAAGTGFGRGKVWQEPGLAGAEGSVGGFSSMHWEPGSPRRHQLCSEMILIFLHNPRSQPVLTKRSAACVPCPCYR